MLSRLIVVALATAFASVATAATFNVTNPTEFQTALTTAQDNGENDIINVAPCSGTGCFTFQGVEVYDITSPLTYTATATEGFALTIDGFDSDTRVLSGGVSVPIMRIDTTGASDDFSAQIIVQGLTLVEGNNTGTPNDGGALYILVNNAFVEVSGSVFGGNAADGDGGALFVRAEGVGELPIVLDDLTFDTNSAGGNGGGAHVATRGPVEVTNIDFFDNDAQNGGGLHIEGLNPADPVAERTIFVQVFDVAFQDNIARTGNGGGADIATNNLDVSIAGFVRNLANNGSGGGLYLRRNFTGFDMVNTGFTGNVAGVDGGGFATESNLTSTVTLTNNTIFNNSAVGRGAGGLLTVGGSTGLAEVYNNIIHSNTDATSGRDIFIDNDPFMDIPATVEFFNNDITDLTGFPDASTFFEIASSAELSSGNNIDGVPELPFIGDLDPDPSQGANSPTIDAGDNNAPGVPTGDWEIGGTARPVDGDGDMVATVDIGMDEFEPGALPQADLGVTKTDSPDPVTGGENVTYSVTVDNAGPDAATGVTVTDTLDQTVTFVSATFSQGSPCTTAGTPVVVTCVLGDIASGAEATGTIVVATPDVSVVSNIANLIGVSGNEGDPNAANDSFQEGTTVVPAGPDQADLAVTKIDTPDPVISGGPDLTYTITVDNNGPDPATGVTLTDTLPTGVTFVSATPSVGQCDAMPNVNGELACGLGDLAVNGNATVTIVVTPDAVTDATTITNTAAVTGNEEDPTPANNSVSVDTTVNPPSSDLSIGTSSTPDEPLINEQITYNVTVSNTGPSDNTGVVLTVNLPPTVTLLSISIDQGSCDVDTDTVTCTIGDLAAGASVAAQVLVEAPGEAMVLTLSATVVADVDDPTPGNNAVSEDVNVIDVIDLIIQGTSDGTGSLSWIELAFLLALAAIVVAKLGRRDMRRRRVVLPAIVGILSVISLTTAGDAQAQENEWYLGISAGTTSLDYSASDLTRDLANLGWTINNPRVDDSNNTWKYYAGYSFNENWAIEAGFADLGEVVTVFGATIPPNQIDPLLNDTLSVHPYQGDGWFAAGVFKWPLVPERLSVVGRAGLFAWESETEVRVVQGGTGRVEDDDSGTDGMFGVGVEWHLTNQWSLTADWERYKLNEWLDVPSIGVRYTFEF